MAESPPRNDEQLTRLARYFDEAVTFSRHIKSRVESVEPGRAVCRIDVEDVHLNGNGTLHGGVYASLTDNAMGLAVAALGHSESEDRVIPARDLEVAVAVAMAGGGWNWTLKPLAPKRKVSGVIQASPMISVVTPWRTLLSAFGLIGSVKSEWVLMSMKPGVIVFPVQSTVRAAAASTWC